MPKCNVDAARRVLVGFAAVIRNCQGRLEALSWLKSLQLTKIVESNRQVLVHALARSLDDDFELVVLVRDCLIFQSQIKYPSFHSTHECADKIKCIK
ncbi:hypothetical protein J1N35_020865 [Gossypium stocksii]|uniref:Uncharacterized protein n=1 Tax=Gossypium stocksii TaxID=47602 RepID=A0A9D3VES0_9ROSI|nr:hypothetical protein J1N35_020865 [Gossypium stocksii]